MTTTSDTIVDSGAERRPEPGPTAGDVTPEAGTATTRRRSLVFRFGLAIVLGFLLAMGIGAGISARSV